MKKLILVCMCVILFTTACKSSTAGYNYESARLQFSQKDYNKAKEYIDNAIKEDSKAEYLILGGQIYYKLGELEEALNMLDKAISSDSKKEKDIENNKQVYKTKAIIYLDMNKYEDALTYVDEALSIDKLEDINEDLYLYKMDILYGMKKYDDTIATANQFVSEYKDSESVSAAYINMGKSYGKKSDLEKADEQYAKAIKCKDFNAYYYQAKTYEDAKDYKKACELYESFMNNTEEDKKFLMYSKQVNCLLKLVESNPDNSVYEQIEGIIKLGLASENKDDVKIFEKLQVAYLEIKGTYEEAYVKAQEYMAKYPEDEAMSKEITFLETRVLKD